MGRRAARRRVNRRQEEYFTTSDRSRSCGHTKARRQETRKHRNLRAKQQKSRGQFVGRWFGNFREMNLGRVGVKDQSGGLTLRYVCGQRKNKKKALKWAHCIYSCCLAILHIFYATAGENYSTGRRPGGFERTSQI